MMHHDMTEKEAFDVIMENWGQFGEQLKHAMALAASALLVGSNYEKLDDLEGRVKRIEAVMFYGGKDGRD